MRKPCKSSPRYNGGVFSFYADESGSAKIHTQEPWFVFLAVGLDDRNWKQIDDSVKVLKHKYFPGWPPHKVEIHSNDIRRAKIDAYPPNPFATLDEATVKAFSDDLYALIDAAPLEWCAAAINKPGAVKRHGISSASELFKLAYVLLLERLHGWCDREGTVGRLFIDQQETNLLGGAFHELVETDHFNLQQRGTGWQTLSNIVERPYFVDSRRSNHMQLADVLAYNVYRRCMQNAPTYPYFQRAIRKVRGNAKPDGSYYGLKIYP
jgi:hypothetical protein